MSIPGDSKGKYSHQVKYVRSRCGLYKIGLVIFVVFVVGMLIALMCNVSAMRRNQGEMAREISELRWRLGEGSNHQGPMRGREGEDTVGCGKGHPPGPHGHHRHHRDPQIAHLQETIQGVKAVMQQEFQKLGTNLEQLKKGMNSRSQFAVKMQKQMQDFQQYMQGLLEPLRKIQNWF